MKIFLPISEFLYELFPNAKGAGEDVLIREVRNFYSLGGVVPMVKIIDGMLEVSVNMDQASTDERDFKKAVSFCENGDFEQAKPLLQALASRSPFNSEVHRLLGQIASEQGMQDQAIDYLIDALRWNPENSFAIVMMGNIWAKFKRDIPTAMKYYEQALVIDPQDYIAANNTAANLMQLRKFDEAEEWFQRALSINDSYPNTHYGLSVLSEQQGDLASAFYSAIQALKLIPKRDEMSKRCFVQASEIADLVVKQGRGADEVRKFAKQMELELGKPVQFEEDSEIPTAAKLEVAENHGRPFHLIKFKPTYPNVEHLQLHELFHLKLIAEARREGHNMLFTVRKKQREAFIRSLEKHVTKLNKMGYQADSLSSYLTALQEGLARQIYNAPIDLFIEELIHADHPDMRPYQFQSLLALMSEAVHATTDPAIVELTPAVILSKSKTYNLLLAKQFHELYGVDLTFSFKPSPAELKLAQKFYDEFKEYRVDTAGGEEFELVANWAKDLELDKYFELIPESPESKFPESLEDQVSAIEEDPLDAHRHDPEREREMDTFQESQKALGLNMAVVMFMVDALQYFSDKPASKIKETALEIAMLGTQGIRPDHKGYRLHHVPNKEFSGYHLLAYYYISWKLALPEMLEQLHLPYNDEYKLAEQLNTAKK